MITPQTSLTTPQTNLLSLQTQTNLQTNLLEIETKLIAPDATLNGFFGVATKIGSNTAVIGAADYRDGSVYTFDLIGNQWVFSQKMTNPLGLVPNFFGSSLALDNDGLVVGQQFPLGPGIVSGQADIYRRIGTNRLGADWVLEQILTDTNTPGSQRFGAAVGISSNTVAVGNPLETVSAPSSGSVSIFNRTGTNWLFQTKLEASDPQRSGLFGAALAIKGDTLIASATGASNTGAAYIFVRNGNTWTEQQRLQPDDLQPRAQFGTSVALETNMAVVGAPFQLVDGALPGAAYVFSRTNSTWTLQQTLTPPGNTNQNIFLFGSSVAIFSNQIVVGTPGEVVDGQYYAGAAYLYQFNGTNWDLAQRLTASDAGTNAQFGFTVDIGPPGVIIGSPYDQRTAQNAGAAYIDSPTPPANVESVSASPSVLSPANGMLVPVTINVTSTNGSFEKCRIVSVSSNESLNRDRAQEPDVVLSGDLSLFLRAKTAGATSLGRIYLITVECVDAQGNVTRTSTTVSVPRDENMFAQPSNVFSAATNGAATQ